MEKYKELYNLSKEVLYEEQNRFNRINEKASKYLTVLTFMMGVYGFFLNLIVNDFIPSKSISEWIIVVLGFLIFSGVIISWFLIFCVLKIHEIKKIPLNFEMINFFDNNNLLDIYYALARGNKDALKINRDTTDRKSKLLSNGYRMIIVTTSLLVLFSLVFGYHKWNDPKNNKSNERSFIMPNEKDDNSKSKETEDLSTDKPNPNIKAPLYDNIAEGYDPSKIKKEDIKEDKEKK